MVSLADPNADRTLTLELDPQQLLAAGRDESMYHRARSYDPTVGRFNRMDPFSGDDSSPLSLHKYAYTEGNPIMGVDPLGLFFTYISQLAGTSIRAIMRNPYVKQAYLAADRASTIADAVETFSRFATAASTAGVGGALMNPALMAGLLMQMAPFGGLLKKVRVSSRLASKVSRAGGGVVRGTVDGISDGLQEALQGMQRGGLVGKRSVQIIGDMGALATARGLGFQRVRNFPIHYHGFDGIFKNGDRFVIVEAKGGASSLGKSVSGVGQMSKKWIENHIKKLDQRGYKSWAKKLDEARLNGKIDGMVVNTPVHEASGLVGNPTFTLKQWDDIDVRTF
ncbi:MAG: RHS repeat-associated core domain-containing protein [Planctomycetota bacterium]